MPRSSGRSSGGRSSSRSSSGGGQQSRGAHTATVPTGSAHHAPASSAPSHSQAGSQAKQPGMLASMAATAGSVAIGSTIGHGLSSMLFGGSSASPADHQQQPYDQSQGQQNPPQGISCEFQAKDFTKCLDKADLASCSWYLDQLKACQAAAKQY